MILEDDSTHFQCVSCNKIKAVVQVNTTKVALNVFDDETQKEFYYTPHWCMICDGCMEEAEKKGSDKDGGDTDTGSGSK